MRIIISENQYKNLVLSEAIQIEQSNPQQQTTYTWSSPANLATQSHGKKNIPAMTELEKKLYNARNNSWSAGATKSLLNNESDIKHLAGAIINWSIKNKGFNPKILKAAITILFRESKATPASFYHPKEILGYVVNLFGGNASQGYAQIKPETAKQYGVNTDLIYTYEGSLDAAYKIINSNYEIAKKYYNGSNVTIYKNNQLVSIPAIDGDAQFHMAFAGYNAGSGIIGQWCQTNVPNIANKCDKKQRDINGKIAITDTSKKIQNYFPNIGNVHNYMPQIIKSYNYLNGIEKLLPTSI